jgi:hypothetical protein
VTGAIFTVASDPADPAASRFQQTILASMPARFRVAADNADIALISGDQPGWGERAASAVRSRMRAVMLTGFRSMTADAISSLSEEASDADVIVAAATPYATNPGWAATLPLIAADLQASAVLDSVATVPIPAVGSVAACNAALRAALTSQLAVIRQLVPEFGGLATAHASDHGYVLAGATPGISVTLAGTVSGAGGEHLALDLVGPAHHWHAALHADANAFPARISISGPDGERIWPPVYESGYRAAWASLHEAISTQTAPGYPADQLARDLAAAEAALRSSRDR